LRARHFAPAVERAKIQRQVTIYTLRQLDGDGVQRLRARLRREEAGGR
jgi:hypothetical protein